MRRPRPVRAKRGIRESVSAGCIAGVNAGIGGGDPNASVYASVAPKPQRRRDGKGRREKDGIIRR